MAVSGLARVLLLGLLSLCIACRHDVLGNDSEEPAKSAQNVVLRILYSGTARAMLGKTHDVLVELYSPTEGVTVMRKWLATHPDDLRTGKTVTFFSIQPGSYLLYVFWDWDDSEAINPDSYEPSTQPYPLPLQVEGYNTVNLDITLVDKTSPGAMGWVAGAVSYGGSLSFFPAHHRLMVRVADQSFNSVAEGQVNDVYLALASNPFVSSRYLEVPPGGPYLAIAWWDTNDDRSPSGDPHSSWSMPFLVSPGLPTVAIDLEIPN